MHIGLFPFITDYSMPIDQLAVAAEERGFDSIWVPEHTHIRRTGERHIRVVANCQRNTAIP